MAATSRQPTTRSHPPNDDLSWDLDQLPLPADQSATDAALAALDEADNGQRKTVKRVRAALCGEIPADEPRPIDWLRAIQHTGGDLVVVTWSSAGFNEIEYVPDEGRFFVAGYSALDRLQGEDPYFREVATRSAAKDLLHGAPRAVTADEATLVEGGAD
ncbi:hypothetical protein [Haloarcula argentinensis]|uniref:Uncharacterized protein n=1 Tax=Haloarcula argentinensis TaxID=43776 RepID=A0A847UN48_HALAR|nr:hypothetical protein [Haloarcula argentinensis]NLV13936.1 hypothetical protein [Haloarcula argentinensis]